MSATGLVTAIAEGSVDITAIYQQISGGVRLTTKRPGIGFSGLAGLPCVGLFPSSPECAVSSYSESGYTVATTSASWVVRTDYGSPGPFLEFSAAAGTTVTGEIRVTAGGAAFTFSSVDLYSSTTPIPYQITGLRNSATMFALSGTIPNTFGTFKTVTNGNGAVIDTLSIVLTNPAAPCCQNPSGLDNIAVNR